MTTGGVRAGHLTALVACTDSTGCFGGITGTSQAFSGAITKAGTLGRVIIPSAINARVGIADRGAAWRASRQ